MNFYNNGKLKLNIKAGILWLVMLLSTLPVFAQIKQVKTEMSAAATSFLQTLNLQQKTIAQLSFNDPERLRWSNEPESMYERKGITIGELNHDQKLALHNLLQTVLSEQGYLKAVNVLRLDSYLHAKNGNEVQRSEGSNKYWLTIFGKPDASNKWGWRFEGHHLSLNFTNTSSGIACTPMFYGADPATFPKGTFAGWQNMFAETDLGWKLFLSLNNEQKSKALISSETPKEHDILTRTGKESFLQSFQGIAFNELSKDQQTILKQLIKVYLNNLKPTLSSNYLDKIHWGKIYFGWWGSQKKGEPVYYRIHGPDFIIEYCSRLNDPNHIHTLFRYLPTDFGK
jgi:hypothetical protein